MLSSFRKKNKLSYEEFGYMYADSVSPSLIELLSKSATEWIGRPENSERIGRELSILSLAIFHLSLVDLIPDEDASARAIGGFMKRLTERYENFAFNSDTTTLGMEYLSAAGADLRNKHKNESFPTLVPLAISKITGLTKDHEYWPVASEVIYSFIEKVLQTSRATFTETKDYARLV